jgi:4-hydroxybenzoate polyprenyltransferase
MDSLHQWSYSRSLMTFIAIVRLIRLPNCIALGLLFIAGRRHYGVNTGHIGEYLQALLWTLLAAFSYLYNDLRDIEIDRLNKPLRPLVSGSVGLRTARTILALLLLAIVSLIGAEWRTSLLWGTGALIASWAYSALLRTRTALLSNLVAGCLVAAVPLSGLPLVGNRPWALAAGIFFLMFGRELQKDALDVGGDRHYRPIPLLFGEFSNILNVLYPFIIVTSGVLLYSATHSGRLLLNVGPIALLLLHFAALIAFFYNRRGYQVQARITKMVSYSLVILLMIRG